MSPNVPLSVAALLAEAAALIKKSLPACLSAPLDASLLLALVLGKSREDVVLNRGESVPADLAEQYRALIGRRCKGVPVAYLTGKKSFWLYDFFVTQDVLIPKPDTELLVEKALAVIEKKLSENTGLPLKIADVCTGSGCVAVSLLAHFAEEAEAEGLISVIATDISAAGLRVARTNADALLCARIRPCIDFVQADLLDLPRTGESAALGDFDVIVSNPPYVPSKIARELLADGRGEPLLALDGGGDGLDLLRRLVPQSFAALKSGGFVLLETGEYNAAQTREILRQEGFCRIETFNDLAGMPRVTLGQKSSLA